MDVLSAPNGGVGLIGGFVRLLWHRRRNCILAASPLRRRSSCEACHGDQHGPGVLATASVWPCTGATERWIRLWGGPCASARRPEPSDGAVGSAHLSADAILVVYTLLLMSSITLLFSARPAEKWGPRPNLRLLFL